MESVFPGIHAAPNVHPLFVHFPIALWLTALLLWGAALLRRRDAPFKAGRWLVVFGTLGAILAVASGYWASDQLGHDTPGHDLVHVHRDFMLTATGIAVATAVAAVVTRRRTDALTRWLLVAALGATNVVAVLGADRGALLVFGYGTGTAGLRPPPGAEHEPGGHSHGSGAGGAGAEHEPGGHSHEGAGGAGAEHDHAGHSHGSGVAGTVSPGMAGRHGNTHEKSEPHSHSH